MGLSSPAAAAHGTGPFIQLGQTWNFLIPSRRVCTNSLELTRVARVFPACSWDALIIVVISSYRIYNNKGQDATEVYMYDKYERGKHQSYVYIAGYSYEETPFYVGNFLNKSTRVILQQLLLCFTLYATNYDTGFVCARAYSNKHYRRVRLPHLLIQCKLCGVHTTATA